MKHFSKSIDMRNQHVLIGKRSNSAKQIIMEQVTDEGKFEHGVTKGKSVNKDTRRGRITNRSHAKVAIPARNY